MRSGSCPGDRPAHTSGASADLLIIAGSPGIRRRGGSLRDGGRAGRRRASSTSPSIARWSPQSHLSCPRRDSRFCPRAISARAAIGSWMRSRRRQRSAMRLSSVLDSATMTTRGISMTTLLGLTERASHSSLGFGIPRSQAPDASEHHSLLAYERPILVDADGLNALAKIEDWWTSTTAEPAGSHSARRRIRSSHGNVARGRAGQPGTRGSRGGQSLSAGCPAEGRPDDRDRRHGLLSARPTPRLRWPPAAAAMCLSGMIGAFLAQGLSLLDAANLGVHVGSRARQAARAGSRHAWTCCE